MTERRASEDFAVLADLLQPALDEIEAIGAARRRDAGVPTGFRELDELTNGLHPGQLMVVAGRPGMGKALALDTPLPTPDGLDDDGRGPGRRPAARRRRPPDDRRGRDRSHDDRPCYEVEFSDGSVIVADASTNG